MDKQCGVPMPDGGLCARSLSCKSHAVGAKRAVVRSKPFDELLAKIQKKPMPTRLSKNAKDSAAGLLFDDSEVVLDSDEEVANVMAGVRKSQGYPLASKVIMPVRRRRRYWRMRESLYTALNVTGPALQAQQIK